MDGEALDVMRRPRALTSREREVLAARAPGFLRAAQISSGVSAGAPQRT